MRKFFACLLFITFVFIGILLNSTSFLHAQEMIDPRSGRLIFNETDLAIQSGSITLFIQRTLQTGESEPGLLGTKWQLNWEKRLIQTGPILVIKEMPAPTAFTQEEGKGEYKSTSGEMIVFQKDGQAIRTKLDWTKERYDPQGRLIESEFLNGNKVKLIYRDDGKLGRMEGPKGAFLKLTSDDKGRVTLIETSTGTRVRYGYAKDGLSEVQINNNPPMKYTYNDSGALTKIERPLTGSVDFTYDAKARVTKRRWADGSEERYEYDDANNTFRQINPSGGMTTTRRSKDGLREEVTDPLGNKTVIGYNKLGLLVSTTGPTGIASQFAYDDLGRTIAIEGYFGERIRFEYLGESPLVKSIIYSDGSQQVYEYDDNHNLLSIKEGDEVISAYTYYPDGLIASIKGKNIPERKFSYHPDGRLKSETNAFGQTTIYEYDKRANLVREINPASGTTVYKYDDQDRLLSTTDPAGATTRNTYDIKGRLVQITNPTGGISRFEYDAPARVVAETDPAGRTTRYQYDLGGRVWSVTYPGGGTYKYTYDLAGNLIRTVNPLGGVTESIYNAFGHLISSTDPIGRTTKYEYSPEGRLTKIINPGGNTTQFKYDSKGRREEEIGSDGQAIRYERDNIGQITKIFFPEGRVKTYGYDHTGKIVNTSNNVGEGNRYEFNPQGQVMREINTQGVETTYRYDAFGNLIGVKDNFGESTSVQFNPQGLLASVTNATKATVRYRYDQSGRLIELINPLNQVKRISYTQTGEIAQVTEPSEERARFEYDEARRLSKIQHPGGGITEFTYDAMGNLLSKKNPLGAKSLYTYDKAGRLISMTNANGQTTIFIYDSVGRLSKKQLSDGKIINYKYDAPGNLIEINDGGFPIRYTYNLAGRIAEIEYPAIKRTLKYDYDSVGLLSNFTNSEGQVIRYEYDNYKRINTIRLFDGKTFKFSYDAKNRLTSLSYPNAVKGTWEYDIGGRPIKIAYISDTGKVLSEWRYAYDAVGNAKKIINEKGQTTEYLYDPNEQLIEETGLSGTIRYSYLPGGNRKQIESKGKIKQYQYNQADHLVKAGEETFKYDANGNVVERTGSLGTTRYFYNSENQLLRVVLPDNNEVSFGYAPTGARIWRRDKNGLTYFVTDGLNLLAEMDEELKTKANYVHALEIDRPLGMFQNGKIYFYHTDLLGSITALTDFDKKISASYNTDAFGNLFTPEPHLSNPFIFTGREYERDLGLYYYRARYYDPGQGRFLTSDPIPGNIFHPKTLNPYTYVLNNPANFIDPFGFEVKPPRMITRNGQKYYVLYRGHLQPGVERILSPEALRIASQQPNPASPEAIGEGRAGSYQRLFELINGPENSVRPPKGLREVIETGHKRNAAGSPFVSLTSDPKVAAANMYSGPAGEIIELHVPVAEVSPNAWTSSPPRGPGRVIPVEPHQIEAEWVVEGEVPQHWIAERHPGGIPPKPPPRFTRSATVAGVAGGVATVSGLAAGGINIAASIAEGNSPREAIKEALRDSAEGTISTIKYGAPAAGVVAGGAYLVGGTAAVIGVGTVALPVLVVGGAVAAVYGANSALHRLANAPAVAAERNFQEAQYGWLQKIDGLVADMEGRIVKTLAGTKQEAISACGQIHGAVGTANNHKNSAQALKKSLADLIAQIKETSALCEQAQTIKARIDTIQSKIKGYEGVAESAYGWAQGNQCSTSEDGAKLRKLYGELEGLSKGVLGLTAEANAKNEDLKTIKNRAEVAKGALGTAEAIAAKIAGEAAGAASAREKGLQQISQVDKLRNTLQEKSNYMQGQVMAFRSWFPSKLLAANENKFTNLVGTVNRFRDPGCDTKALKMELDQAVLESRLDNQTSQGLIGSVRGTLSACDKIAFADGAAGDIQGSVDHMLILVAGVKIKADECTVKMSQDRTTTSGGAAVQRADCSRWPGSIPQWNNQTNRAECFCPQGMVWNKDRTRCIDARQAAVENTDCSRWPGSVPMWNNQTNRAECFCPQGMVWNQNRTACISARQQPPPPTGPTPTGPPRQVKCNDTAKQGGNTPETLVVDLGRTSGVFRFDYNMFDVPDRMVVRYGGGTYDTQCTGGKQGRGRDKGSVNLQFFGSSQVTIQVLPACQGGSTSWNFTVHCPK